MFETETSLQRKINQTSGIPWRCLEHNSLLEKLLFGWNIFPAGEKWRCVTNLDILASADVWQDDDQQTNADFRKWNRMYSDRLHTNTCCPFVGLTSDFAFFSGRFSNTGCHIRVDPSHFYCEPATSGSTAVQRQPQVVTIRETHEWSSQLSRVGNRGSFWKGSSWNNLAAWSCSFLTVTLTTSLFLRSRSLIK